MALPAFIERLYQWLPDALAAVDLLGRVGCLLEVLQDLLEDLLDVDPFLRRTFDLQDALHPRVALGHLSPRLLELGPVLWQVGLVAEDEHEGLLVLGNLFEGLHPLDEVGVGVVICVAGGLLLVS